MQKALQVHDRLLSAAIAGQNGSVFKTVGDAFCAVFHRAIDAVTAAADIQRELSTRDWQGLPRPIRVRMGVHTGEAQERDHDFYGPALNRVARLQGTAHGGQTVLSLVTAELLRDRLPEGITLKELGEHRLKDLARPESVYQLVCPDLPADFPPLRSLDRHQHNLPVQLTPFIGREKDVEEICTMLTRSEHAVVTIVGPGGMGKTRTALQVAADVLDHYEDGAFFVDLAAATSSRGFYVAIADVFQIAEAPGRTLQAQVTDHLQRKRLLLLLDNFEQISSLAPDVAQIVSSCPDLQCLVTSRVPLHIRPEIIHDLNPLSTPQKFADCSEPDQLTQFESVRLFIDRARAAVPNFQVSNDNAPAVAEICHRLDGIPLAIELAAARTRVLPPRAMLARLGKCLDLLTGGALDLPERQQTLRATLDWSHDLLDRHTRAAFAALASFDGLIRLEAAEAVLPAAGISGVAVIDVLQTLLDQSLLIVAPLEEPEPIYAMLQTVHEYAAEKLQESPEHGPVMNRHAGYFAELAARAREHFHGPDQVRWIRLVWLEFENMRGAATTLRRRRDTEEFARLATDLAMLLDIKGRIADALSLLEDAVSEAHSGSLVHTRALAYYGNVLADSGREEEGIRRMREARAVDELPDDLACQLECDIARAMCQLKRYEDAAGMLGTARSRAAAIGNDFALARVFLAQGELALRTGETTRSRERYRLAIDHFTEVGDRRQIALAMQNLGVAAYFDNDLDEARVQFNAAIGVMTETGSTRDLLIVYNNLGSLCLAQERHDEAEQCFKSLIALAAQIGDKPKLTAGQGGLADVLLVQRKTEDALAASEAALRTGSRAGKCLESGLAHRVAGDCYAAVERNAEALRDYTEAEKLFSDLGESEELQRAREGIEKVQAKG
ncbi:MAG: tetratricopeptide repeat protein [Spirochaetaceae bacterium]|nr:tetratricopeptide repeat protein [Spirochaetaceae bacterium]